MFLKKYMAFAIDALGSMVYGLFASLLVGTILKTIFGFIHIDALRPYFQQIIYWTSAGSPLVGAAIGVAVLIGLKSKPLAIYSAAVVGGMAYLMNAFDVVAGTPIKATSATRSARSSRSSSRWRSARGCPARPRLICWLFRRVPCFPARLSRSS